MPVGQSARNSCSLSEKALSNLIFIRHGETAWNREKRFQGHSDVLLNERGLLQAELLAGALQREGVSRLFSSPLARARQTAEIIGERLNLDVEIMRELTELSFGEYEGELEADLRAKHGQGFAQWREAHYTEPAPGGDSISSVKDRAAIAAEAMTGASEQGSVAAVAHQAIFMAVKAHLRGDYSVQAARSYKQQNNEIDIWDVDERKPLKRIAVFGSYAGRLVKGEG